MLKNVIKIARDYFRLVSFWQKFLLAFIAIAIAKVFVSLLLPYFASMIVESLTNGDFEQALIFVGLLAIDYILLRMGSYGTNWCYANYFKRTYVEVHKMLVDSVYRFDEEFSRKISTGKIINSSNMDIVNIAELPSFLIDLVIELAQLTIIYIVFARQSLSLALYIILVDLAYYLVAEKCNLRNAHYMRKQYNYADKLIGMLSQVISGLKDIKSFGLGEKLNRKLDLYRKRWQENYFLKRKYYFTRTTLVELIVDSGKIVLYVVMIIFLVQGRMQIAMFLLLISYYEKARDSLKDIMSFDAAILEESVSFYRLRDVINYTSRDVVLDGAVRNNTIAGRVEFRDVSFRYAKAGTLEHVSFVAEPNQVTVIVGKTGAGKTTIFNLLLRLYKVKRGQILIDGLDIYQYSKEIYGSNLSVVNQRTFIFNMSIQANLSLVDTNKERQREACRRVGIHDYIMSLPEGYNTILKEDATNLSGGQKQLLSLARALLTTSEIILLDEVTAALDPRTTQQIIGLLDDLKTDHTILVITHDKDLMKVADRIVVLKNGRVVETGKHAELMRQDGVYRKLWRGEG